MPWCWPCGCTRNAGKGITVTKTRGTLYQLLLTKDERKAFDWVGERYSSSGYDMAQLIQEGIPIESSWDDAGDITFSIPEHVAWEMQELAESEDFGFPCLADSLVSKLWSFFDSLV